MRNPNPANYSVSSLVPPQKASQAESGKSSDLPQKDIETFDEGPTDRRRFYLD